MEARARGQPALNLDRSAMFAHNAISDRKPQAGSLAGALSGEEWIVDPLQVLRGYTLPIVTYIDARKPVRVPGLDRQPGGSTGGAALLHGVARIQEQIQENLLQLAGIALHAR